MSGAVHEPDPRVERLVEQARYWQGMHTIDIPTDELRGLLVSAFEAGQREPSPAHAEALAAAQERAQRAEDALVDLRRVNGELGVALVAVETEHIEGRPLVSIHLPQDADLVAGVMLAVADRFPDARILDGGTVRVVVGERPPVTDSPAPPRAVGAMALPVTRGIRP